MKKTISLLVLLIASASHIGAQEADSAFVPAPNQNPAETSTNFTVKVRLETEMDLNLVSSVAAFELHPSFPSIFKAGDRVLHQDGLIRKDRFSEDAILRSSQKDGFVSFTFPNPGWYVIFQQGSVVAVTAQTIRIVTLIWATVLVWRNVSYAAQQLEQGSLLTDLRQRPKATNPGA